MRKVATVLVVVGMVVTARAADADPVSYAAFTTPASADGLMETQSLLADSTFVTSDLSQPQAFSLPDLLIVDLSPTISIDITSGGCDPSHPCTPTVVPEPGSMLLFGSGLMALGAKLRHRRRQNG
jgi:hypothetical protein